MPLCAGSALSVTARPGAGAMQQQYATIGVANRGSGCWLVGYARVSLRVSGHALGTAAVPAHTGTAAFFLRAGGSVTALLHGPSTCNSPLSDHARVAVPGRAGSDLALPMRGCALVIDPFVAGTDPFGGGTDPFGGGTDPFRAGTAP